MAANDIHRQLEGTDQNGARSTLTGLADPYFYRRSGSISTLSAVMGQNALFEVLSARRVPLLGGKFRPAFRMVAGQPPAGFLPLADQAFALKVDSEESTAAEGIQGIADRGLKLDPTTAAVVAQLLTHAEASSLAPMIARSTSLAIGSVTPPQSIAFLSISTDSRSASLSYKDSIAKKTGPITSRKVCSIMCSSNKKAAPKDGLRVIYLYPQHMTLG
ncbi:hypothetical protein [Bradyrhizobium sp.]|uniref:hypothetical protein n=1 Tax=Bradyrhizobium sp. TaxID=376 RepID=UPI003BAE83EC